MLASYTTKLLLVNNLTQNIFYTTIDGNDKIFYKYGFFQGKFDCGKTNLHQGAAVHQPLN